ncbi:MAG: S41 family peptidase [Gemmataceae bacterium]
MTTATRRFPCQRLGLGIGALLLLMGLFARPVSVSAQAAGSDDLVKQAAQREKQHDWEEACRLYDELLHRDHYRDDTHLRQAYQRCLRRYRIVQRHQDEMYRTALEHLKPAQALDTYAHVLETIGNVYTDRQKSSPAALFAQGVEELALAFEEPVFTREYFHGVSRENLDAFRKKLSDWRQRKIANRSEARDQVAALGRAAQQICSGARPIVLVVIAVEFLSGACNALDEYTFFLPPGHFREVQAALRGRLVSIGVELEALDDQLVIHRVYPHSTAAEAGLKPLDRIVRIEGQSARELSVEKATELLRGKAGTIVRLEVVPAERMDSIATLVEVKRAVVIVPSVEYELLREPLEIDLGGEMKVQFPIGKLTINYFQESTLQEVKEALAALQMAGMKVLILDLRHNPGGLFKSAIEVAELFLPEGIIVVSQTRIPLKDKERKLSGTIRVENPEALLMPMLVLIDGETASAAEVLAGALKGNGRAKLLGQPSFGKGTLQCVIPLDKAYFQRMPAGIRITVAKLFSPHWEPYSGKGIEPNYRSLMDGNAILIEARQFLLQELQRSLETMAH